MIVIFFCIWSQQWGKLLMHPLSWNNGGSAWRMLFPWSSICFLSKWKNTSPTWSSLLPLSFPFLLSLKLWLLKLTERKQWMTEAIEKCYIASGINKIWFLKRLTLKAECSTVNRTSVSYPLLSRLREHWRGKGGKVCKSQRVGGDHKDTAGRLHTWTHSRLHSKHKTMQTQARPNPSMGRGGGREVLTLAKDLLATVSWLERVSQFVFKGCCPWKVDHAPMEAPTHLQIHGQHHLDSIGVFKQQNKTTEGHKVRHNFPTQSREGGTSVIW